MDRWLIIAQIWDIFAWIWDKMVQIWDKICGVMGENGADLGWKLMSAKKLLDGFAREYIERTILFYNLWFFEILY
jgi:hypothetical protein